MSKSAFCICENKDADQLCSNCTTDQRLCFATQIVLFRYFLIQNFQPLAICAGTALLCRTWSETAKTGFLALWLVFFPIHFSFNQVHHFMHRILTSIVIVIVACYGIVILCTDNSPADR